MERCRRQLFLKNGQPKDAAVYLRAASTASPENVELRNQLALAYLQSGQSAEVLELIAEPMTADDHYFRASAYYLDHHFEEADRESDAALTVAPDNPRILACARDFCNALGNKTKPSQWLRKPLLWRPTGMSLTTSPG